MFAFIFLIYTYIHAQFANTNVILRIKERVLFTVVLRAHETTINVNETYVNEPRKMTPGGLLVCAFSDCSVVVVSLCVGIILRFMPGVEVGMSITQSKRIHAVNVSLPWYF